MAIDWPLTWYVPNELPIWDPRRARENDPKADVVLSRGRYVIVVDRTQETSRHPRGRGAYLALPSNKEGRPVGPGVILPDLLAVRCWLIDRDKAETLA